MLEELAVLHQQAWSDRGFPGSFSSKVFFEFHRRLVRRCFSKGMIQLLRVRAGQTTIGSLYNFMYRGKLSFYQSGFDYRRDKRLSPGIVVHVLAIEHACNIGLEEYDFLAGDTDYKKKLASKHRDVRWLTHRADDVSW